MSSTNRGADRQNDDFYATPAWAVDGILPHLPLDGHVLEPAAGEGAIVRRLLARGIDAARIRAIEIDPGRAATCRALVPTDCEDALRAVPFSFRHTAQPDLIFTNPPFSLAEDFARWSLTVIAPGGTVALLLRLAFLEGQKRRAFHFANPCEVFVLPKRPSFTGGKTDSCAYAWFVWGPGRANRWRVL